MRGNMGNMGIDDGPIYAADGTYAGDRSDVARMADSDATIGQAAPIVADSARAFILAGKAIFTIVGRDARYTFKVSKAEPKDGWTSRAYFVSLLVGQDNTSDYAYMGLLDAGTGLVRLTRKSAYVATSRPLLAINWVLARLWTGADVAPAEIYHAGRCGRCGRLLTVPSSIASGYGPECIGKLEG